uniref:Major facilitator superfamily (MFS) profile domain-containing protein n=1 Tax=Panagrolaimus superbus TaxID=310955 RepID=A0A914YXD4_9BILA
MIEPSKTVITKNEDTDIEEIPIIKRLSFEEFIHKYVKDFGPYQWIMMILMALPCFAPSLHLMSWVFIGSGDFQLKCIGNYSGENETNIDACKCEKYEFIVDDKSVNAITAFDIVCDRYFLKAMVHSSYYVGQMIGSLALAFISDTYGRRIAFLISVVVEFYCATWLMVPLGVWAYMLGRIGLGFSHYGLFTIPVLLALEFLSPSKRKWACFGAGCLFAVGQIILALIAMLELPFLKFQFALFVPLILLFVCAYFAPESARWLLAQNKFDEAEKVLTYAAKINKAGIPADWKDRIIVEKHNPKNTVSVVALLKTPKLRTRTIVVIFLWPIVSMLYYGMSTKMDLFGGNKYQTFIFGAFIEIPANGVVTLIIDRLGRKGLTVGGLISVAICMFLSIFITENTPLFLCITQIVFARFAITITYSTIYTYTPELFPTVLRGRTVGIASFCARLGGIGSSYLVLLLVDVYGRLVVTIPFMTLALLAAIGVFFLLPETAGTELPQTIDDVERKELNSTIKQESGGQDAELVPLTEKAETHS